MRRELLSVLVLAVLVVVSLPATSQVSFYQPLNFNGCSSFVADFNGDGNPDLLCPSLSSLLNGTLSLGNGNGTFSPGPSFSGTVLAVMDFNGDGKPDLLEQGTGTLLVLLGNGDGTFQTPITTPSGADLSGVAAADLNGDGQPDVVGVFNNSLYVYIGNGDGTFKSGVPYSIGASTALPVLVADFNGDRKLDVAVTSGQVVILLGNDDGTFQPAKTSAGPNLGYAAFVSGDFNGDGKLDLALSGCTISDCGASIMLGNGDGTFQSPIVVFSYPFSSSGGWTGPLAAGDVNGDGKLDLIFSGDATIGQIYLGKGDGTFSSPNSYIVSLPFQIVTNSIAYGGIAIADFNLDGKLDVALDNGILLGNGDGSFQGVPLGIATPGISLPVQVSGKFERNGAADIAQINGSQVFILHNSGAGVLTLFNTYTLQQPGFSIAVADFNGDGNVDLAVAQQDSATSDWGYSILLGNGDGSFQAPVYYPQNVLSSYHAVLIYAADFNNDHKPDLAVTSVGNQSLAILLGNGDGTFASPAYYYDAGSNDGTSAVIADFNGDGNLDIAVVAKFPGPGILYGKGDGTFQVMVFPASLNGFAPYFTADLNNDGKPDLLGVGPSSHQVALGNGDGTFTLLSALPSGVAGVADFNGDGKLDLLEVACCSGHVPTDGGVALGKGDGTFGPLISAPSTTNIASQNDLFVDMNGDGRIDIVFGWSGTSAAVNGLGVLFNTTSDFIVSATVPSPSPLAPGDSATSTVTSMANFGFNAAVALSCAGLPTGATCSFNPASIANAAGTSQLTIGTTLATPPGTYAVQVLGKAGSTANGATVSLMVQSVSDFTMTPLSGSPTSQTVSAGQAASFSLSLAGSGTFIGTVNLSCAVTPAVTLGPTCTLSSSSAQISGSMAQSVTVNIGTSRPSTAGMVSPLGLPPRSLPFGSTLMSMTMLVGFSWLALQNRKRAPLLAGPAVMLAMLTWVSCGGSSPPRHTQGTPAGTYTATVTATSGSLNHTMPFTVTVQ